MIDSVCSMHVILYKIRHFIAGVFFAFSVSETIPIMVNFMFFEEI